MKFTTRTPKVFYDKLNAIVVLKYLEVLLGSPNRFRLVISYFEKGKEVQFILNPEQIKPCNSTRNLFKISDETMESPCIDLREAINIRFEIETTQDFSADLIIELIK